MPFRARRLKTFGSPFLVTICAVTLALDILQISNIFFFIGKFRFDLFFFIPMGISERDGGNDGRSSGPSV